MFTNIVHMLMFLVDNKNKILIFSKSCFCFVTVLSSLSFVSSFRDLALLTIDL